MKPLLSLLVTILIAGSLNAQDADFKQFQQDFQKKSKEKTRLGAEFKGPNLSQSAGRHYSLQSSMGIDYLTESGIKIRNLRQDNMPCVIPDTRQYNMPVLTQKLNRTDSGSIPNPFLEKGID